MTKQQFRELFLSNVRNVLSDAQRRVDVPLSAEFDVELHGAGVPGKIVPLDEVIDRMWVSEHRFYPFIDVGVIAVMKGRPRVFVRVTGYAPVEFERTWNTPKGNGAFKLVGTALNLRIER